VVVDARVWPARRPHADARLRGDAPIASGFFPRERAQAWLVLIVFDGSLAPWHGDREPTRHPS
jgi:hypothetical protein